MPEMLKVKRQKWSKQVKLEIIKICKFYPPASGASEQVSKANLRSKQGGINFAPFVLSLPYAKKKKKKKN